MRPSCWHQNFGPNGLSAPTLGLCLNMFSSITADFKISSALRWAIQDHLSSGYCTYFKNDTITVKNHDRLIPFQNEAEIDFKAIPVSLTDMSAATNEPPHDKTNKMTVRPAKTQVSLGIHPIWSESSLSAWRKLGPFFKNTENAVYICFVFVPFFFSTHFQKKPLKKPDSAFKKPEGMHRELWGLLWTDNRWEWL